MKHKIWYHLINKIIHEWIPQTHQHDKIKVNSLVIARHALCSYRSVAEIAKCQVKMVLLLLIFVTTVAAPNGEPTPYTCKWQDQPRDCQSIKILKTRDTYQLTLCLDNVNKCSANISFNFRCCAICDACETLLTSGIQL